MGKPFAAHPIVFKALHHPNQEIPPNCIGIHGILYDPNEFQKIHPGGPAWIEISKGTDATSLFEIVHVNNKLAKYHLNKLPSVGTYTIIQKWDYSSYREICKTILHIFPTAESRTHSSQTFQMWVFFAATIHMCLLFQTDFTIFWAILLVVSAISNTVLGGFGHNYLHKFHPKCLALDWNGLSSFEWMLEHVLSHHCNPNSEQDHDTISMLPFVNWQEPKKINILIFPLFAIGEIAVAIQGYLGHMCRWYPLRKSIFPLWLQLAPFLFLIRIASHFLFQPCLVAISSILITLAIASFYFSYLAHLNHAFQGSPTLDFLEHQLSTTGDIQSNSILPNDLLLGLDKQIMHHLFPTIDHALLTPQLRNLLQKTTKQRAFTPHSFAYMNKVMWTRLIGV